MGQRVVDFLHHSFIQLGFAASDLQLNLLAQLLADIMHHALKTGKGLANLHHPQLQCRIAYIFDQIAHNAGNIIDIGQAMFIDHQPHRCA